MVTRMMEDLRAKQEINWEMSSSMKPKALLPTHRKGEKEEVILLELRVQGHWGKLEIMGWVLVGGNTAHRGESPWNQ